VVAQTAPGCWSQTLVCWVTLLDWGSAAGSALGRRRTAYPWSADPTFRSQGDHFSVGIVGAPAWPPAPKDAIDPAVIEPPVSRLLLSPFGLAAGQVHISLLVGGNPVTCRHGRTGICAVLRGSAGCRHIPPGFGVLRLSAAKHAPLPIDKANTNSTTTRWPRTVQSS
jgi:hypothetical protein